MWLPFSPCLSSSCAETKCHSARVNLHNQSTVVPQSIFDLSSLPDLDFLLSASIRGSHPLLGDVIIRHYSLCAPSPLTPPSHPVYTGIDRPAKNWHHSHVIILAAVCFLLLIGEVKLRERREREWRAVCVCGCCLPFFTCFKTTPIESTISPVTHCK